MIKEKSRQRRQAESPEHVDNNSRNDTRTVNTDEKINSVKTKTEKTPVKQKPVRKTIKLEKLRPFEGHPYKVADDEAMEELKTSIASVGLLNRIFVRPVDGKEDEYEIISGHRRVHAAKSLGMKEIPAIVYFVDRDEATLLMVDSNTQRTDISPMEKGRAYKMKLEAMKRQGQRTDTSTQNAGKIKGESADIIGKENGMSGDQVRRYIRLIYLVPELQEYVDSGRMKMLPAVEISYLDEEAQRDIVDRIIETEVFPSHAQARKMRALFDEGKLDYDTVAEIMAEKKPNQIEKVRIAMDDIRPYVPKDATPKQITELAVKLFKQDYERKHNKDAR